MYVCISLLPHKRVHTLSMGEHIYNKETFTHKSKHNVHDSNIKYKHCSSIG